MSAAGRRAVKHCHGNTPTYLRRENVTFIEPHNHVVPKQPGLESSRFCCLGCPSTNVLSRSTIHEINQLKQAIITEWNKLLQRFIDRAIGQWRRWLD